MNVARALRLISNDAEAAVLIVASRRTTAAMVMMLGEEKMRKVGVCVVEGWRAATARR